MTKALWSLVNVSLSGRTRPRLDRITVEVEEGSTAVLGWSGAGKTSLLNLLVGFERPDSGDFLRHEPREPRLPVFWVPPDDGLWPHVTAEDHVRLMLRGSGSASNVSADCDALLAAFDLDEVRRTLPGSLSRGERSRLSLARGLAADVAALVLDEPLAHVDPSRLGRYREVFVERCRQRGTSIVFATHSPEMALSCAERAICLRDGRLVYAGGLQALYRRPATAELASFLGPHNWVTAEESRLWLRAPHAVDRCWRPEHIALVSDPTGSLIVERSWAIGSVTESTVLHEPSKMRRTWLHATRPRALASGDRVAIVTDEDVTA